MERDQEKQAYELLVCHQGSVTSRLVSLTTFDNVFICCQSHTSL